MIGSLNSAIFNFSDRPIELEEADDSALKEFFADIFKSLCSEKSSIQAGPWYADRYILALEENIKNGKPGQKRLDFLIKNSSLIKGLPPKDWQFCKEDQVHSYTPKPGVSPSQALQGLAAKQPYFTECNSMIQIADYIAMRHLLGKANFDHYFTASQGRPLIISRRQETTPLHSFWIKKYFPERMNSFMKTYLIDFPIVKQNGPTEHGLIELGDRARVSNFKDYMDRFPLGKPDCGQSVVCTKIEDGVRLFSGFGLPRLNMTVNEIRDVLISGYMGTFFDVRPYLKKETLPHLRNPDGFSLDPYQFWRWINDHMESAQKVHSIEIPKKSKLVRKFDEDASRCEVDEAGLEFVGYKLSIQKIKGLLA